MNVQPADPIPAKRRAPPLIIFLSLTSVLFIGILIFVYVVTKRTNPVFLDEHGKPVAQQPAASDGSH